MVKEKKFFFDSKTGINYVIMPNESEANHLSSLKGIKNSIITNFDDLVHVRRGDWSRRTFGFYCDYNLSLYHFILSDFSFFFNFNNLLFLNKWFFWSLDYISIYIFQTQNIYIKLHWFFIFGNWKSYLYLNESSLLLLKSHNFNLDIEIIMMHQYFIYPSFLLNIKHRIYLGCILHDYSLNFWKGKSSLYQSFKFNKSFFLGKFYYTDYLTFYWQKNKINNLFLYLNKFYINILYKINNPFFLGFYRYLVWHIIQLDANSFFHNILPKSQKINLQHIETILILLNLKKYRINWMKLYVKFKLSSLNYNKRYFITALDNTFKYRKNLYNWSFSTQNVYTYFNYVNKYNLQNYKFTGFLSFFKGYKFLSNAELTGAMGAWVKFGFYFDSLFYFFIKNKIGFSISNDIINRQVYDYLFSTFFIPYLNNSKLTLFLYDHYLFYLLLLSLKYILFLFFFIKYLFFYIYDFFYIFKDVEISVINLKNWLYYTIVWGIESRFMFGRFGCISNRKYYKFKINSKLMYLRRGKIPISSIPKYYNPTKNDLRYTFKVLLNNL